MSKPFTTEKFINDATAKFHHKFDYSKVSYTNATSKVTIVCPNHGEFLIGPWKFLNSKHGCKRCGIAAMASQQKAITRAKLEECKSTNSHIYEYPTCVFNGIKDKIPVNCKKHGMFYVTVDHHLHGVGCKKCADSNKVGGYSEHWFNTDPTRKAEPGMLYIIEVYNDNEKFIKIGITKKSIDSRYKNSPFKKYKYTVLHQFYYSLYECFTKEALVKESFKNLLYIPKHRYHYTESFQLSALPEILALVQSS